MGAHGVIAAAGTGSSARARRLLAAALLTGLALRVIFAFGYWTGKPLTLDEQEYLLLATSIARGEGVRYADADTGPVRHFERPPGFAAFLAGLLVVTRDPLVHAPGGGDGIPVGFPRSSSDVPAPIRVAQSLVGGAVILLVAALARQAAGTRAAIVAAWLCAVYPPLVWMSAYVLAEPLYCVLALTVAWLASRATAARVRRGAVRMAAAGALAAGAMLTKEAIVFFVPIAAAWLVLRGRPAHALVFVLALMATAAPWVARNYAVHGKFVLTAPHGGVTFWTGNNELASGEGDLAANPAMGRARAAFERQHADLSSEALDAAYYAEAWQFIRRHPVRWLGLAARKVLFAIVPLGPSYRLHSWRYFGTSLVAFGLALPLALAGLLTLVRARRLGRLWALWLLALSVLVTSVVFFPQERFRIPVIDPTLVVCAAAWIATLPAVRRLVPAVDSAEG